MLQLIKTKQELASSFAPATKTLVRGTLVKNNRRKQSNSSPSLNIVIITKQGDMIEFHVAGTYTIVKLSWLQQSRLDLSQGLNKFDLKTRNAFDASYYFLGQT